VYEQALFKNAEDELDKVKKLLDWFLGKYSLKGHEKQFVYTPVDVYDPVTLT
jgi:hypothetical protein